MRFRIRELRESKGMTCDELARRANITRTTLWALETKEEPVAMSKTLLQIANVLGVKIGDLFYSEKV